MTQGPSVARFTAWAIAEAGTMAVVSFGTLIAMAWLLGPVDFGIAATAITVTQLLLVFVGAGLVNGPLIQREDLRQDHIDTAFWTAFGVATVLAAVSWFAAEPLADWLGQPRVAPVLAVASLVLLPTAYEAVQIALLRRAFGFREIAIRTVAARLTGATLAIAVAFAGGGPWSIVVQHLATVVVSAVILRAWTHRHIGLQFRLAALKDLMAFSAPALVTEFMSAGGPRLLQLVAAFLLGPYAFAFLNIGLRLVETLREMVTDLSNGLAFPIFARVQDDPPLLARHFLTATSMLSLIGMPAFLGLGAFAPIVVPALIGDAWLEAVPVVRVLAFGAAAGFGAAFYSPVLWALGRPALGLLPRAADLVAALGLLMLLAPYGPAIAAFAWAARQLFEVLFALLICPRVLPLRATTIIRSMAVPVALSAGVVLVLLAVARSVLTELPPRAEVAALGGLGAMLTLLSLMAVHPAIGQLIAARFRPTPRRG